MRIVYVCNFSYPFWEGVWNNVYHLSKAMIKKGNEVHVFSSNLNPTGEKSSYYEVFQGINIHRFDVKYKIGSYGLFFDFEKEMIELKPDLVHAHVYRNPCAHKSLEIAKKLNIPCFLTTHAPFERKRDFISSSFVNYYDYVLGKKILNSYTKVIAITKWEIPHIINLGLKKGNLEYIPNGVEREFLIKINNKKNRQVIYIGRISEIKNPGLLVQVAKYFKDLKFKIFGPIEKDYKISSKTKNLKIVNSKYDSKTEIKLLEESDIYILPSKSEGFPQTLLEAMAAGKIVIASATKGSLELIREGKNGFIFYDFNDLIRKIRYCDDNYYKLLQVRKNAQDTAKNFLWENITDKINKVYSEDSRSQ